MTIDSRWGPLQGSMENVGLRQLIKEQRVNTFSSGQLIISWIIHEDQHHIIM